MIDILKKKIKRDAHVNADEREFLRHLELSSYIRIPGNFDHEACFREGERLLPYFIEHKNEMLTTPTANTGRWMGLVLRSIGGELKKIAHHEIYKIEQPKFEMTEWSRFCPKIIDFLRKITCLEKCEQIRLMLLEPYARIPVHSDYREVDVCVSTNIALNMPEGCSFIMDCKPDGSFHQFTKKLPFEAGDIMILNTAPYHYVFNDSPVPRIHLMFTGPLTLTLKSILKQARVQNGVKNNAELIRKLAIKYRTIGSGILPRSILFELGSNYIKKVNLLEREFVLDFRSRGKEFMRHLDLVPYLRIPGEDIRDSYFSEAKELISSFTPGGYQKILNLRDQDRYCDRDGVYFRMTDFSLACPQTMTFLNRITDVHKCGQILFALLEPGTRTAVCSYTENGTVALLNYIYGNIPEGCQFFIDCNSDGSHHMFTQSIPLESEDITVVNATRCHYLVNNSQEPWFFIVFGGPIRFTPEELLSRARQQNSLSSEKEVIIELAKKYREFGFNGFSSSPFSVVSEDKDLRG